MTHQTEILIVGAGPAGMAAAVRAQQSGARVTLLDDNPSLGGQIWRGEQRSQSTSESARWFSRLRGDSIATLMSARVISADAGRRVVLVETQDEALELSFEKLILATGAREVFLPFPGWALPGVMGVGGLQAMVKSGLAISGKKVVVAGSGPLLLAAAAYLRKHGAKVSIIAEQASREALVRFGLQLCRSPGKLIQAAGLQLSLAGIPYLFGAWVEAAEGDGHIERVRLRHAEKRWTEDCDYAAIAYGLYPSTELASLLGCRVEGECVAIDELQRTSIAEIFAAGECTGIGGLELSVVEGEIAGYAAGGRMERARSLFSKRERARSFARSLEAAFALREELKKLPQPETIVCRCEDVRFQKLQNTLSFRCAKLHTRLGMGPCQGRICGPAADFLFGWRTESIRPPIFPARVETLAFDSAIPEEASK